MARAQKKTPKKKTGKKTSVKKKVTAPKATKKKATKKKATKKKATKKTNQPGVPARQKGSRFKFTKKQSNHIREQILLRELEIYRNATRELADWLSDARKRNLGQ